MKTNSTEFGKKAKDTKIQRDRCFWTFKTAIWVPDIIWFLQGLLISSWFTDIVLETCCLSFDVFSTLKEELHFFIYAKIYAKCLALMLKLLKKNIFFILYILPVKSRKYRLYQSTMKERQVLFQVFLSYDNLNLVFEC